MRKRILTSLLFALVLSLALTLTLAACGGDAGTAPVSPSQQPSDSGAPQPSPPELSAPSSPAVQPDPQPSGSPAQSEPPKAMTMEETYRFALEGIFRDHLYPNGTEVDVPESEFFDMGNNDFAVFDVDGDGRDELIYQNDDSHTVGMITTVYGFDRDTGMLYQELSGYVAMEFYDNGVVTVMASHNHGLAPTLEDFWPYAIYQYDPGSDGYLMAAAVDAWDGEMYPQNHEGNPFPSDIDRDGDKVVYILTVPGAEVTDSTMDGPEYQAWLDFYLAGASKLELPWKNMTEENIRAVAP